MGCCYRNQVNDRSGMVGLLSLLEPKGVSDRDSAGKDCCYWSQQLSVLEPYGRECRGGLWNGAQAKLQTAVNSIAKRGFGLRQFSGGLWTVAT